MNYADAARLMRKIDRSGDHWLWTATGNGAGYGQMCMKTPKGWRPLYAHRLTYELFVGPIPAGLTLDHLCRVRNCVNPAHLEPVTNAQNILRGDSPPARNARKTHCAKGHPLPSGGRRRCGTCHRAYMVRYHRLANERSA